MPIIRRRPGFTRIHLLSLSFMMYSLDLCQKKTPELVFWCQTVDKLDESELVYSLGGAV